MTVQTPAASKCCVHEQDTLSVLLQSTQLRNVYQAGQPREGCLYSAMSFSE